MDTRINWLIHPSFHSEILNFQFEKLANQPLAHVLFFTKPFTKESNSMAATARWSLPFSLQLTAAGLCRL